MTHSTEKPDEGADPACPLLFPGQTQICAILAPHPTPTLAPHLPLESLQGLGSAPPGFAQGPPALSLDLSLELSPSPQPHNAQNSQPAPNSQQLRAGCSRCAELLQQPCSCPASPAGADVLIIWAVNFMVALSGSGLVPSKHVGLWLIEWLILHSCLLPALLRVFIWD